MARVTRKNRVILRIWAHAARVARKNRVILAGLAQTRSNCTIEPPTIALNVQLLHVCRCQMIMRT